MRHRAVVILFALLFASCTTVNVNPNGTAPDEAPSAPTEQAAAQQDGEDDKEDEDDPLQSGMRRSKTPRKSTGSSRCT